MAETSFQPLQIEGRTVFQLARGQGASWFATTKTGLYRRDGWSGDWQWLSRQNDLLNLTELPDGQLVSGQDGDCEFGGGAPFRVSRDGGRSWRRLSEDHDYDNGRPRLLGPDRLLLIGCNVRSSADGGRTWKRIHEADDTHGDAVDAVVDREGRLFVTEARDSPAMYLYRVVPGRPPRKLRPTLGATALSIDAEGQLYLADNRGVFRSGDGGKTFRGVNQGLTELVAAGRKTEWYFANSGYRFTPASGACKLLLASPVGVFGLNAQDTWVPLTERPSVLEAIPTPVGLCLRVVRRIVDPYQAHGWDHQILCDSRAALPC